jgi:branched-chain amino acid transport system permease protein
MLIIFQVKIVKIRFKSRDLYGGRCLMDMKRSHIEDVRVFSSVSSFVAFVVLMILLAAAPLIFESYVLYVFNVIAIHVIIALGMNILVGYTGQISLGHAGFYAIGAYTSVILMTQFHVPFVGALLCAGLVAAAFGFLLGLPALRLSGPYLAIATLGFGIAVVQIIGKWESLSGGHMGLHAPKMSFGSYVLQSDAQNYYFIMPLCVLATIGALNLTKSKIGRAFVAIRDSDIAAEATGVNLTYYKTLAFAVSAFFTGIAGSLTAHTVYFISPENYNLFVSINFLVMVVIGGLGSILGSVLGAILLVSLQHLMSGLQALSMVVFGSILIVIVLFEPLGLRGRWLKIKLYWKMWPF